MDIGRPDNEALGEALTDGLAADSLFVAFDEASSPKGSELEKASVLLVDLVSDAKGSEFSKVL